MQIWVVMFALMDRIQPFIAVLDDEPQMGKALGRLLKTHGFEVLCFTQGAELFAACASRLPDCLLLDVHMPEISGFDVLERFTAQRVSVPVVVITGHDQPGNAARVRALGAAEYLLKPLDEAQLLAAIGKVMNAADLKKVAVEDQKSL